MPSISCSDTWYRYLGEAHPLCDDRLYDTWYWYLGEAHPLGDDRLYDTWYRYLGEAHPLGDDCLYGLLQLGLAPRGHLPGSNNILRSISHTKCQIKLGCQLLKSSVVDPDPYSGPLWIRIRIPKTDPDQNSMYLDPHNTAKKRDEEHCNIVLG